jgi:hypothetical protein
MLNTLQKLFVGAALALTASACQLSPYNNQWLESKTQAVTFQGCTPTANELIEVRSCRFNDCPTRGGLLLTTFRTGTTASAGPDSTGTTWYCGSVDKVIPYAQWYAIGGIKWRTYVQMWGTVTSPNYGVLASFDNPPADCPANFGMEARLSTDPKCASGYTPPGNWTGIWSW